MFWRSLIHASSSSIGILFEMETQDAHPPFDKLRANGARIAIIEDCPFVLSPLRPCSGQASTGSGQALSKLEYLFFQQPAKLRALTGRYARASTPA